MPLAPKYPRWSAGIIERHDNHILIVLPGDQTDSARKWQFPRGAARENEPPEAAMRRMAHDELGLDVEVVVGQPPLIERIDGTEVELRYFFCGVAAGEAIPGPYAEVRWVSKGHLREYEFDGPSKAVAEWLLNG